jgi:4-hydroxy-tetrahydrodipicolinate synthase
MLGLDCGATRPPSAWPPTEGQQKALSLFLEASKIPGFGNASAERRHMTGT